MWWGRQFNVNWVADPDFATGQNNAHDTCARGSPTDVVMFWVAGIAERTFIANGSRP
jgi:hypothetical protein